MRVGSLFAGIGGFDLGFERAGMETVWQVEIDPKCRELLAARFPRARQYGDVRACGAANLEPVDVICGGFPCQDLSVAGKRAGLAGERSGLFYEMTRIVNELRPSWLVWENVPGLLSSNSGRDFAAVLVELERIGYLGAWTTLDARYFGVAQRRRRIFGVFTCGDSGAERAATVLALSARLCGNPAPGGKAREATAVASISGLGSGGQDDNDAQAGRIVTPALQAGSPTYERGDGSLFCVPTEWPADLAPTLNTAYGTKWGLENQNALGGGGLFVPVDGRTEDWGEHGVHGPDECRPQAQAFAENQRGELRTADVAPQLSCSGGKPGSGYSAAQTPSGVRRLTPTECERLQGFPDGWTEGFADTHRYRMLGNAVAVPCAAWIGKRLVAAHTRRN